MKKLLTLILILCAGVISGNAFGQDTKKQEERKGGIAVGGFDNTRQDKAVKRSVEVSEEAAPVEKAAEAMPPEPAAASVPPAEQAKEQKELQDNQARSLAAKDKQKLNKHSKSKGKHK
jgi:hypothetical protein